MNVAQKLTVCSKKQCRNNIIALHKKPGYIPGFFMPNIGYWLSSDNSEDHTDIPIHWLNLSAIWPASS